MFCTISILPQETKRLFARRRCLAEAVQTAVKGGAPFLRLAVTPSRKGVDWALVERAVGRNGRFALLPDGIVPPQGCRIQCFAPDILPLKIMLNTAAQQLKDGREQGRSLLICDEEAVLADYVDCVAPCASLIRVQTERPQAYYEASARLMERFGVAISVCPTENETEEFDAAVSMKPLASAGVSFDVQSLLDGSIPFTVPEEYLRLCPEQIEPFLFLCALYECSGVRAVGELTADAVPKE
ncbi:MAG TPA: hypothetical protein DDY98_08935 [Ruminococcaceae bacterium]|nr:hypothetical protein [Oscillospiraceae bacterium]